MATVQSDVEFRNLFEYDLEAKLIFNLKSDRFIDCNQASSQLFGITKQNLTSLSPINLIPKYCLNEVRRVIYKIHKGNPSHFIDVILNRGTGKEPFPAEIVVSTLDCLNNVVISVKDISCRRNVEDKMKQFNKGLKRLLDEHALKMSSYITENLNEESQETEITDLIELVIESEKRLIEFEKIQALSTLTAGISHELNNALNVIVGGKNLIQGNINDGATEGDTYAKALEYIDVGANRAIKIMNGLMSCSKRIVRNLQVASVDEIITGVVEKMSNDNFFKSDISSFKLDLNAGLEIYIHPEMISTALENVILNACYFSDESESIKIRSYEMTEPEIICIEIFNPGEKISEADLSAIFDPFFTTKEVGKGEGLGLSIAKACMMNHYGDIKATNRKNGVSFILEIPL